MAVQVKAIFEFCFQVGDIITVKNKDDAGWWEGELLGQRGLFPSNYVEPYPGPSDSAATEPVSSTSTNPPPHPISSPRPPIASPTATAKPVETDEVVLSVNPAIPAEPAPLTAPLTTAASSSSAPAASTRKPAGPTSSGGARKPLVSRTKFGLWSSNMAWYTAILMIVFGLISILWRAHDDQNHGPWTMISGIYAVLAAPFILIYEGTFGQQRGPSRIPVRATLYIGLSIILFFALPTVLCGVLLAIVGILNFISSTLLKESYDAPPRPAPTAAPSETAKPVRVFGITAWIDMIRQQNKVGILVFMTVYVAANAALFGTTVQSWIDKNHALPESARLSKWGPWAKGFGSMLDLNCAIIVLPVSRTLLRLMYNKSTQDQGLVSRIVRAVLTFIPLDQSITFHKIIARVILFAACGHVVIHFINLAFAYHNTLDLFGTSPWFTGAVICLTMMIIYTATPDNTKKGQFEIFIYSHHCFVLFFFFILVHGKNGINPHYWMYAIPTMTIYVIERALRIYRASLPVSILSVSLMGDVLSLEFAKEGFWSSEYSEGQYVFICAPPISNFQWHPFTISSAPQDPTVTVHIRVSVEGSWTQGLMEYMRTMGPKQSTSFIQLDRMGPNGRIAGKLLGPEGRPILQLDGPHSAPTQHVGEYSTVMVIGAGIGATPVASTMKSIVYHKWRVAVGACFPSNAYFMWVCAHRDIDAFRWLIRTIKEVQDEVMSFRSSSKLMETKAFEFHIFLTSAPKEQKPVNVVIDDEIGFWGPPREASKLNKVRAEWTEIDLYKAMKCPSPHAQLGDVHIWSGRPRWPDRFTAVSAAHPTDNVGVAFCGSPMIARDLRQQCYVANKSRSKGLFKLHKENF